MNKVTCGLLSAVEVTDPAGHGEFNRRQGCERQPETLALDGVASGSRWAAPRRYMDARMTIHPQLGRHQYLTDFLFTKPPEEVSEDLQRQERASADVFKASNTWGLGLHAFRKAYVAPRMRLSPEALPFRPNRGVFVVVKDLIDLAKVDETARWHDEVHIPDVLMVKGVMGCYWFQSLGHKFGAPSDIGSPAYRRVFLYYLDEDPMAVMEDLKKQATQWHASGRMLDTTKSIQGILTGIYMSIPDPETFNWHKA